MVVFRSAVIVLVMAALPGRCGGGLAGLLRTRHPFGHAVRTLPGFFSMTTSYLGYVRLPLAGVTALNFAMPLFLTVLSVPLLAAGVVTAAAQWLMTEGYRGGEATAVAPFEYGAIVHATILGALFWGEWPGGWSFAGIAVPIGAGLFIWRRETGAAR